MSMRPNICVANEQPKVLVSLPYSLAGEQDILIAIARGKVEALDVLYQRYHRDLYALAYSIVSDHQLAEDLIQETFVRVWRRAASYSPQVGSVRGWLFTILRNY